MRVLLLPAILCGVFLASTANSLLAFELMTTGGTSLLDDMMADADVFTGSPSLSGNFGDDSSSPSYQTFQVDTDFTLSRFAFAYEYTSSGNPAEDITFSIFEIADVFAPAPIALGTEIWSLVDVTIPNEGSSDESARIDLELAEQVLLPATTGSAGYAFGISGTDDFEWIRSNSGAGSTYAFGQAYQGTGQADGSSLDRDFFLALGAIPPPPTPVFSVQTGDLNTASTWDTNLPPEAGFSYNVSDTHTVTANSASFAGENVVVNAGGTFDIAATGLNTDVTVDVGGTLNIAATGVFLVGDGDFNDVTETALVLNGSSNISAAPGANLALDVLISGTADLDFQGDAGSSLFLSGAGDHEGTIRFDGSGDRLLFVGEEAFNTVEMNSTGANRLIYEPTAQLTSGFLVFNQPGEIVHNAPQVSSGLRRLHGPDRLAANADIVVDLTQTLSNERRLLIGDGSTMDSLSGTGNITVNGTASDPTSGSVTHNEFEIGNTGEPTFLKANSYSGTITSNDFVDLEIRESLPNARIVINSDGRLEMGSDAVASAFSVAIGEVEIRSGGGLVVGYEADGGHNAYQLTLTSAGSRSGSLTLAGGSTTVMQVNGTADGEFDSIIAQGDVALGGALEILVNPDGAGSAAGNNPTYTPTLGDTFDIISIVAESPAGDYNADGEVTEADYDVWVSQYGIAGVNVADGNGDGIVNAADYTVWRDTLGTVGSTVAGAISGTFSGLSITDPGGVLSGAGLTFQIDYVSPTLTQLRVVSASAVAVPEPTAALLAASLLVLTAARRSR